MGPSGKMMRWGKAAWAAAHQRKTFVVDALSDAVKLNWIDLRVIAVEPLLNSSQLVAVCSDGGV